MSRLSRARAPQSRNTECSMLVTQHQGVARFCWNHCNRQPSSVPPKRLRSLAACSADREAQAPPAHTNDSINELSLHEHPRNGAADTSEQAGFSGRQQNGSNGSNGALERRDFTKFVHFFRMSSSYIGGHRNKTFVIVIPGDVSGTS